MVYPFKESMGMWFFSAVWTPIFVRQGFYLQGQRFMIHIRGVGFSTGKQTFCFVDLKVHLLSSCLNINSLYIARTQPVEMRQ